MRRAAPKAEGLYEQLAEEFRVSSWGCHHLPRCPVGTPVDVCPHPSSAARSLAAGEPVDVAVWQLPGRGVELGLDMNERVRVFPDGRVGPAAPLIKGPRPRRLRVPGGER